MLTLAGALYRILTLYSWTSPPMQLIRCLGAPAGNSFQSGPAQARPSF